MQKESQYRFRYLIKLFRNWRKFRDKFAASLDVNSDRKVQLYVEITKASTVRDVVYWLQIIFSAGIATLGLVINSSAVIIGAMLISPLMGPILSAGLALATGDLVLAFRSSLNLFLSTLAAVAFALTLVALLPFKDITPEIIARTKPNILDLVIALFSGAIGSIATCREVKGVVTSIPGVAIAVALMPPICVVGFGIGVAVSGDPVRGFSIAGGGGLLYLTNLVAITFTAMLVFILLRIDTKAVREKFDLWKSTDREHLFWRSLIANFPTLDKARRIRSFSLRLLMILLPLMIISIPLSQSFAIFRQEFEEKQFQNAVSSSVRKIWEPYSQETAGGIRSYLDELRVTPNADGKLDLFMRVFYNRPYSQAEKSAFVERVAADLNRDPESISLQMIEIPTSQRETERAGAVIETTPTPLTIPIAQNTYRQLVSGAMINFALPEPASLIDYSVILGSDNSTNLQVDYLSAREIDADGKSVLQRDIRRLLNAPNASLSFNRVSSEVKPIAFERNSGTLEAATESLLGDMAVDLQRHKSLRVRIMIKKVADNKERTEQRKQAVRSLFVERFGIAEERLAISEIEDDELSDSIQIFLRKES